MKRNLSSVHHRSKELMKEVHFQTRLIICDNFHKILLNWFSPKGKEKISKILRLTTDSFVNHDVMYKQRIHFSIIWQKRNSFAHGLQFCFLKSYFNILLMTIITGLCSNNIQQIFSLLVWQKTKVRLFRM